PDVLQHLGAVDEVGGARGERQPLAVRAHDAEDAARAVGRRPGETAGGLAAARPVELGGDDARAAADVGARPERFPPAAEVDDEPTGDGTDERLDPPDER